MNKQAICLLVNGSRQRAKETPIINNAKICDAISRINTLLYCSASYVMMFVLTRIITAPRQRRRRLSMVRDRQRPFSIHISSFSLLSILSLPSDTRKRRHNQNINMWASSVWYWSSPREKACTCVFCNIWEEKLVISNKCCCCYSRVDES